MRTTFAYRDFKCKKCGAELNELVEVYPQNIEFIFCECGGKSFREEKRNLQEIRFKPFWSDTFEMRVNDREDMKKIKSLRKQYGLECVGHQRQKQDDRAVRYNYEND